jgi:CheY-like chemotaxis protein
MGAGLGRGPDLSAHPVGITGKITDRHVDLSERDPQLWHGSSVGRKRFDPTERMNVSGPFTRWAEPSDGPIISSMAEERTLLIVEDNSAVSAAIRSYMSRYGRWTVVLTASDAGRGLLLAAEHQPEAIVLDNRMPGGDGIDVLEPLRTICPEAIIVMHTSDDSTDIRLAAERLGADAVVSKGRPLDELAAFIDVA